MRLKRGQKGFLLLTGGLLSMLFGYLFEGPTIDTSLIFYMASMVFLLFGVRFIVFSSLEKRQQSDVRSKELASVHKLKHQAR